MKTGRELPIQEGGGVVGEVVTHPRAVDRGIDPDRPQVLGRPDTSCSS
jgi:hypothetical protein